eukprot:gnl/MRDRNA2_/MRDRNA2_91086_c0_seq1.p1 gnl/MRDRNA2_/MRDRNA2_91086_c0~~gnl/MRDRNA2_/MRDRNA2_91086_c0_seq1.p1  ORF type:complete len:1000 (-),score=329.71 gnl/MRDRNA2_/MRDRNA2_91086_c0_seq1:52-3051(-)
MVMSLLALLLGPVVLAVDTKEVSEGSTAAYWHKGEWDLHDQTQGPVGKVAKLLVDMQKQLEKDADEDSDMNEEMICWCKQNDKALSATIKDNTEKSGTLTDEIKELRAKSEGLSTEIDNLKTEVDHNQKELDTAVELRKTEMKDFNAAESSTFESIKQLEGAQAAISRSVKSMMQSDISLGSGTEIGAALKNSIKGHHEVLWAIHSEKERKIIAQLMAHERDIGFIQQSSGGKELSAPFDIVHGTIQSLNDAFKENLAKMQSQENDAQAKHEAVKKAKSNEITAGVAMMDKKTATLADVDERAAAARQELDDTNEALNSDTEFLAKVKEQCAFHSKVYEARVAERRIELSAISNAHYMLTHDDSKDLFTKVLGGTRRGEKLGSKNLKEFKEERDTESMRSQTNKARKQQWGTSKRYLLLQMHEHDFQGVHAGDLRFEKDPATKKLSVIVSKSYVTKKFGNKPAAKKLSEIASETEAYWSAKYYNEDLRLNTSKAEAKKAAALSKEHAKAHAKDAKKTEKPVEKRNKLGLTAAEMKTRKNDMAAASEGVTKMRQSLELQQGEEAARRDWCQDEIIASEKQLDNLARDKKDHEEKIQLMAERMARLRNEIKQLRYEQEDADIETQKAANDRKKECSAYQKTVMHQIASKDLLGMAMKVLESFYGKLNKKASLIRQKSSVKKDFTEAMATMRIMGDTLFNRDAALSFDATRNEELKYGTTGSLLQGNAKSGARHDAKAHRDAKHPTGNVAAILGRARQEQTDAEAEIRAAEAELHIASPAKAMLQGGQEEEPPSRVRAPPPPGFGGAVQAKNSASGGVMTMMENIMEDTQAMIDEAVAGETEAMKGYEAFVAQANAATKLRNENIVDRQTEVGKLEQFTQEEKAALSETINVRNEVRQYNIDLYGVEGCQFLLKNYEVRYVEREEEINSLKEAEAILGAGGGDPKMAAVTGKNDPTKDAPIEYTPTEDGVEAEGEVPHGDKAPEDERAVIHMAGGTQVADTR